MYQLFTQVITIRNNIKIDDEDKKQNSMIELPCYNYK